VSLQAMNLAKTQAEVFLFEPIPRHILAIKHNFQNHKNVHIESFALSDQNGVSVIFTEMFNHGNSSMWKSVVEPLGRIQTKVQLVNTKEYCGTFLIKFDSYVIKCDTQGMDALILSRVPNRIWAKVQCAIIEIWALPEIDRQDVYNLLLMCQQFKYISWYPGSKEKLDLNEIRLFWTNNSRDVRNLYLSKN
jgi:FkbM family methyltransferase